MLTRTPLSKYDYGYLKGGGPDWFGGAGGYYGPPHSLWWSAILPWILPFGLGLMIIGIAFAFPGG